MEGGRGEEREGGGGEGGEGSEGGGGAGGEGQGSSAVVPNSFHMLLVRGVGRGLLNTAPFCSLRTEGCVQ